MSKQRWVIKIGSALLTNDGQGLDKAAIENWVAQIAALQNADTEIVLVSSGAVVEGMARLGWHKRPSAIHDLQAAAAVGQMGLVQTYEQAFQQYDLHTALVLIDNDDLTNRQRYLNARSALLRLIELNVVPVINENDTVVTDEIRFGDNDTLAALIANLIDADRLIILTDQHGLFEEDPRKNPNARLVERAAVDDEKLAAMVSEGGSLGRGGMITKLRAAKLAARSGTETVIVGGRIESVIQRLGTGESVGTCLTVRKEPQTARKLWLAGRLKVYGQLTLDQGATNAVCKGGVSLLPIGVKAVHGEFQRGDMVACLDPNGLEIARGLINYSYLEAQEIIGKASADIENILGYSNDDELIHCDNLVIGGR